MLETRPAVDRCDRRVDLRNCNPALRATQCRRDGGLRARRPCPPSRIEKNASTWYALEVLCRMRSPRFDERTAVFFFGSSCASQIA